MHRRDFLSKAAAASLYLAAPLPLRAATPGAGPIRLFLTSDSQKHAALPSLQWSRKAEPLGNAEELIVVPEERFQSVLGFGSALTDASCFLLSQMDSQARTQFLEQTYDPHQMALNVGRCSIGACDYSRYDYDYDDVPGDLELRHFSIAHDRPYILPTLRQVRAVSPELFLLASPWSPPSWMKTYRSLLGGMVNVKYIRPMGGAMNPRYLETYAHYIVRFLESYRDSGVSVDAVTSQNEVEDDQRGRMPACYWPEDLERRFVRDHLGPLLDSERLHTQIWLLDHNYSLWRRAAWQLEDPALHKRISGLAWHGYEGTPDAMSRLHYADPDVPSYWTEGGPFLSDPDYATNWVKWGSTFTAVMQNWSRSIITWNLVLDERGEPNIGPYTCGGLVTLTWDGHIRESGQYWALRHFSQHVRRGALRIGTHSFAGGLDHVAFRNPDGSTALILTNTGPERRLQLTAAGNVAFLTLPRNSIATLSW